MGKDKATLARGKSRHRVLGMLMRLREKARVLMHEMDDAITLVRAELGDPLPAGTTAAQDPNMYPWADAPAWATHAAFDSKGFGYWLDGGLLWGEDGEWWGKTRSLIRGRRWQSAGWEHSVQPRPLDAAMSTVASVREREAAKNKA